jgi:aspartyl/glutamyl-tRNA(Asn/Gln) amidotransferase C subunit
MGTDEEKLRTLRRMIREAYLALPGEDEETLVREVAGLLDNVEILAALEVEAGPPPPAVEPVELRPDEAQPSLPQPDALANAPEAHDGFVSVPKVLGADDAGEEK